MSTVRLRARTPSARFLATGCLRHHALRWHKLGRDGSGKCDVAYRGLGATDVVWGVLFDIDCAEKADLDRVEGLGLGYVEREVSVVTERGERRGVDLSRQGRQSGPGSASRSVVQGPRPARRARARPAKALRRDDRTGGGRRLNRLVFDVLVQRYSRMPMLSAADVVSKVSKSMPVSSCGPSPRNQVARAPT